MGESLCLRRMRIPEYERVIYERNPLIEVVCQIRFPVILKIAHEPPVSFQERVRKEYPEHETRTSSIVNKDLNLPPEILALASQVMALKSDPIHFFTTEDRSWSISLGKDFCALVTSNYERYENFKARLSDVLSLVEEIYQPSSFSRIGIRYQNLIIPSDLGLEEESWRDLISENVAHEFHQKDISESIITISKQMQLKLRDGTLTLRHGLVTYREDENSKEQPAYLIDTDLFTNEKAEKSNVWKHLDEFNRDAGRVFRWSITDKLHVALTPRDPNS